jgi:hypothetical protein
VALKATVYSSVIDEQDTVGYFHDGGVTGCPDAPLIDAAGISHDGLPGRRRVLEFLHWNPVADPGACTTTAPMRVDRQLPSRGVHLERQDFDARYAHRGQPAAQFHADFTDPYNPDPNVPSFGSSLTTAGLFEVLGSASMTGMAVCSTRACPEAREIPAKFWFNDPVASDTIGASTGCTFACCACHRRRGTSSPTRATALRSAGLSKLVGSRTRPRESNQGLYLIPIFIAAEKK